MACRVGMTTDPITRKAYWSSIHPTLRNWNIVAEYDSKSKAQVFETEYSRLRGCVAGPGGEGPEYAKWYVYEFEH